MSTVRVEVAPEGAAPTDPAADLYTWPAAAGHTSTMRSDLDWQATQLGAPASQAKDLLRIVTGAYMADRVAAQPSQRLARSLFVTVHVDQPDAWTERAREHVVDLLHWLTGDDWALRCVPAPAAPTPEATLDLVVTDDVSLLSGGLDSLCGALIRLRQPGRVLFLGHADTSTAVRHAQQRLQDHMAAQKPARDYDQYALRPLGTVRNRTPKTRSLLFMAMAVAAASGTGATRVLVPENGFTSINPPLEPSRAGVMTTRSTHPWTFEALGELLGSIALDGISVVNPHNRLTKGELLAEAMPKPTPAEQELAARTVSCAKINTGRPRKGSPNLQCGLCVACLVRRAAFLRAGIPDLTAYALDASDSGVRDQVRRVRRHDIAAWRSATTAGIPEHRILGSALWPRGTDFDAVLALCERGLKELTRVPV